MRKQLTTNEEWRLWGKRDPMYGVAAWKGRQKGGINPWAEEDFYELGRSDWNDFQRRWQRYGALGDDSVVEIGCGAGRITKYLAESFKQVHAFDVSDDMIAFAKKNIAASNIQWAILEAPKFPIPSDSVSNVFTCHVLQHLESLEVISEYFRESFRILKPGGSILAHVPIHIFPQSNRRFSKFVKWQYRLFLALSSIKATIKRLQMRLGGELYMHGISVDKDFLFSELHDIGYKNIEIVSFLMNSNGGFHICVLCEKPT